MLTKETLEQDLHAAMKAGDEVRKRTLRMLISSIKLREVDQQSELQEAEILSLVQKEVKSREETIEEAKIAGREDLIESSDAEIEVLQQYLPEPLSEDELNALIDQAIQKSNASGPQDMGQVMKEIMADVQGRADGKIVSNMVRTRLENL